LECPFTIVGIRMQTNHSEDQDVLSFFEALFCDVLADRKHYIEARWLDGTEQPGRDFFRSVPRFFAAVSTQEPGTAVYFGVHARNGRSGKNSAVDVVTCLYADIDYKNFQRGRDEALALAQAHPYSILVESGHGLQDYVLLDGPLLLEGNGSYQCILKGYQQAVRSDPVHDLARVLRVPGTINYKDMSAPVPCRILCADYARRYRLHDLAHYAVVDVDGEAAKAPPRTNGSGRIVEGQRHKTLVSLAGSMRRNGMEQPEIEAAIQQTNRDRCDPALPADEVSGIASSVAKYPTGSANANKGLLGFQHNDAGNAQRIILRHGDRLRYNHSMRAWFIYDGTRWKRDEIAGVKRIAKETIAEFYEQAVTANSEQAEKFARVSLDAKRIDNALYLAQCEIPVRVEDLDSNPDLLNCANGTIDLRSGELRPHDPADLITKIIPFSFDPNASCPLWENVLLRAMGAEIDKKRAQRLVYYMQTAFGYSATGLTREKLVHHLLGSGDNGKTTILDVAGEVLGDYSTTLGIECLTLKMLGNNETAELADLRGARFVRTSETQQGQSLNEARLKRITQGMGVIKAARKYENPISFPETHKLWIDANHRPIIRGTDNAIWNRLVLIPFDVSIPKAEQDSGLREKLLAEASGILAWIVRGAVRWYHEGLQRPVEVSAAVDMWRTESDPLADFIGANCRLGPGLFSISGTLWNTYEQWAIHSGVEVLDRGEFAIRLQSLGCHAVRRRVCGKQVRGWTGIALNVRRGDAE
jgi:P4 family phage/plasmid primase-like protien